MNGITLKFSNSVPPNARVYTTSDGDEAIINYNKKTGNIIGTLKTHDGKAFALEKCGNNYIFEEFDVQSFPSEKENEHEGLMTEENTRIIDTNMTMDRNEIATYSIMVYYTPEFAATTPNIEDFVDQVKISTQIHIRSTFTFSQNVLQVIAETNQGYINSKIPVRVKAHCIEQATINDEQSASNIINKFSNMKGTSAALRNTADAAALLVQDFDSCGIGMFNTYSMGKTIIAAQKACALGYFSFGHELGHNLGCMHNTEAGRNNVFSYGHGHLIEAGSRSTGVRTIMAYNANGHRERVNYYSNPDVIYPGTGTPTGVDGVSNNAAVITKNRFAMAALGDESSTCSSSSGSSSSVTTTAPTTSNPVTTPAASTSGTSCSIQSS